MADDTENVMFKGNLDVSDILQNALKGKQAIMDMANSENLSGMIGALSDVAVGIGIVGAAFFAAKSALDLEIQAEQIKQVNNEFTILTQQAGLATDALKRGMLEAANGTVDETTLLKSANAAIVAMGGSAAQLPELMTLARKATVVYGGSVIDNFNAIAQAIESGNVRALKHLGLTVDINKADRDYAKTLGENVSVLSQAGKQQAIMNAVIEKGKTSFKGVDESAAETQNTWAQFKASLVSLGETFTLIFDKVLGPTVRGAVKGLKEMAGVLQGAAISLFGTDAQKASQQIAGLNSKIAEMQKHIVAVQSGMNSGKWGAQGLAVLGNDLKTSQGQLEKYQAQLKSLGVTDTQNTEILTANGKKVLAENAIDNDLKTKHEAKFYQELTTLQQQFAKTATDVNSDISAVDKEIQDQIAAQHAATAAKIKTIQTDYQGEEKKIEALVLEEHKIEAQQIEQIELKKLEMQKKALDNLVKYSKGAGNQMVAGWKQSAGQAGIAMQDFSQVGNQAFTGVQDTMVAGFTAIGSGSEDAATAMKNAFLKALGQMAVSRGSMMIAEGIGTFNPLEVAEGGVLVALGSALGAAAAATTSSAAASAPSAASGAAASSVAPGSVAAPNASTSNTTGAIAAQQGQVAGAQRSVTVQFHGDYIDTAGTRQLFMDMIRKETDATDFKYVQVGE